MIIIIVTIITLCITATKRNHIALYIMGKNVTYGDILRRSKKSLKLNLELLIEIDSANLITDLRNDLINIL
jgi:ABC-type siderophore export system fused ATPase/permease subunit